MPRNYANVPAVDVKDANIAQNAALSTEVLDMRRYVGGFVYVPGTWTAANIGFDICDTVDGTFTPAINDDDGLLIQIGNVNTGRAGWYKLPIAIFSAAFMKLRSKSLTASTETSTNQAGARALKVMLK